MGGCANMCQSEVEFEQLEYKISRKNCETLERYGQGAAARREAHKMKLECLRQITGKYKSISIVLYCIDHYLIFIIRLEVPCLYGSRCFVNSVLRQALDD